MDLLKDYDCCSLSTAGCCSKFNQKKVADKVKALSAIAQKVTKYCTDREYTWAEKGIELNWVSQLVDIQKRLGTTATEMGQWYRAKLVEMSNKAVCRHLLKCLEEKTGKMNTVESKFELNPEHLIWHLLSAHGIEPNNNLCTDTEKHKWDEIMKAVKAEDGGRTVPDGCQDKKNPNMFYLW